MAFARTRPPAPLTRKPPPRSLAGDYGFDPLNLGRDPEALRWYQQAELVHARTAMTAVAGILIPSVRSRRARWGGAGPRPAQPRHRGAGRPAQQLQRGSTRRRQAPGVRLRPLPNPPTPATASPAAGSTRAAPRCAPPSFLTPALDPALQILTKAGALNVPEWYEAGKVSNETSGIPFSEPRRCD
jgi:hypothetical protein